VADSEDALQISIRNLKTLKLSTSPTKTMAFNGRDPVRSKIVINNNIIEQINIFSYPGYSVSYQNEKYITIKITKFLQITGIIKRTLKPLKSSDTLE